MNDNNVLLVPDTHGRDFWREPVFQFLNETDGKIIFLGDYVDPYPNDFEEGSDYRLKAFLDLNEIVALKDNNINRITLLLGNHDCGYIYGTSVCECRMDYKKYDAINKVFTSLSDLFQFADECVIGDKHFIFSHAGILKSYATAVFGDDVNEENIVKKVNDAYHENDVNFIESLKWYDNYRGYLGVDNPSLIWGDVRTWLDLNADGDKNPGIGYNVFGHTKLVKNSPCIPGDGFTMIDTQNCYVIDNDGILKKYKKI